MPKQYEDNYYVVETSLDKRTTKVSFFKDFHYQDEIELKNVPEDEVIKLLQKVTEVYLEEEDNA